MAAGRPGLLSKTGLNTFVDPRQQGARQSPRTPPDFVEVMNIAGEEWLLFKPVPVTVAFLRGTTADEDGNVTMTHRRSRWRCSKNLRRPLGSRVSRVRSPRRSPKAR